MKLSLGQAPDTESQSQNAAGALDGSSRNSDTLSLANEEDREVQEIKESSAVDTSRVRLWRFVVGACLAVAALVITVMIYLYLNQEEQENFDEAFQRFSTMIHDSVVNKQRIILGEYKSLADTFTTSTQNAQEWPSVTLPFFAVHARNFLSQSGLDDVAFYPAVNSEDRDTWLEYATLFHEDLVKDEHVVEGTLASLRPVGYNNFIARSEEGILVAEQEMPVYYPTWQTSPAPSSYRLINWNLASVEAYGNAIGALIDLETETVVSPVQMDGIVVPTFASPQVTEPADKEQPRSMMFHPIHEIVDRENSPIVGVLAGSIEWEMLLRDILPEDVSGIIAVVKNTCNDEFSYGLTGAKVTFRGLGDLHDRGYNDKEVVVDLALHTNPSFASTMGHCLYSMHLYPSKGFEDDYTNSSPQFFGAIIAVSFGVAITVFLIYDMYVQRRNQKLVAKAAHFSSIVSSLFPGTIRQRIMNGTEKDDLLAHKSGTLRSFLDSGAQIETVSKPLAELIPEVSVLYAGIVGFTKWSANRDPPQVFTLLETVYGVFDELAKKRGIYKIETVGDCFVAVSGLPNPVKDHAEAMAGFARDIVDKIGDVCRELGATLGPDTANLTLRVGMHSGPVTAGVLRGERARFQLFGDTVNTCSLLESTGASGQIHLSQETADLLSKGDGSNGVRPRADKILAKGEGEMQTFWLSSK